MQSPRNICLLVFASLVLLPLPVHTQTTSSLVLRQHAMANHPFTVVGEGGAVLGTQDGVFEIWQNPVKLLRDVHITAHLQSYDAPLQLNTMPATIEVQPSETVITLSHAAITVREHFLVDRTGKLRNSSALAYFEIHATRPADLVISFQPVLQRQWPAPNFGVPNAGWRTVPAGSGYILSTDNPAFYGIVCIPGATQGPTPPYQERTRTQPVEMHLHFDPATDDARIYPLLTAVSDTSTPATFASQGELLTSVLAQRSEIANVERANAAYYENFLSRSLSLTTPDPEFDAAFQWAEVSVDQSRIRSPEGLGLAAGWSNSDDTARPGFGWFFGRDTLWSLYAVNSYGDFDLTRQALDFLLLHQRADGKMMHEYSQTAQTVDWNSFPYLYAAADATPLFLMQMQDYVRASGDIAYLKQHWDNVRRAYDFLRTHTDDGLYSNAEGTGWVEEWPVARPHQEVYLAILDVQGRRATAALAKLMHDDALASKAGAAVTEGEQKLAAFRQPNGWYAFSRNADNTFDTTESIFSAVAWWDSPAGLPGSDAMLDGWAASPFSVDWGIRSVPSNSAIYDPISYHHGSVWPLYTGWVALADYRAGRALEANQRMRQTMALDQLQDLGASTEVISGEFLQPLSRSSSHQLWSSAMAIAPVVRGMLGLQPDALHHTLQVDPHLPASWDRITIKHVRVGPDSFDLQMIRKGETLQVEARSQAPMSLCLTQTATHCNVAMATLHTLSVPLPAVEVDFPSTLPSEGDRSSAMHVLHQVSSADALTLDLEAPAGSTQILTLRKNRQSAAIRMEGAELNEGRITVHFPGGSGYVRQHVVLHW